MANEEQLAILGQGAESWNAWRRAHPAQRPDLSNADLGNALLVGANLSGTNLARANLQGADLRSTDLTGAALHRAQLDGSSLDDKTRIDDKWRLVWNIVNRGAANRDLSGANLAGAYLSGADLTGTDLKGTNLNMADLSGATLSRANLAGAKLGAARLNRANLTGANLSGAYLHSADLCGADLSGADLTGVDLSLARLDSDTHIGDEWRLVVEVHERAYYLGYTLHELPDGVLYGHDGASIAECDELLGLLAEFVDLAKKAGLQEVHAKLIKDCAFHFRSYRDYLVARSWGDTYKTYLESRRP